MKLIKFTLVPANLIAVEISQSTQLTACTISVVRCRTPPAIVTQLYPVKIFPVVT